MSWTRAQETLLAAISRNPQSGGQHEVNAAADVLESDETVYEILRCAIKGDSWPLLIVTDRRILYTVIRMFRGWESRGEIASAQVTGATLERRLLSGRVRVRQRSGKDLTVKVADPAWSEHVVGLINHLASGGAPPRV